MADKEEVITRIAVYVNKEDSPKYSLQGENGEWYSEFKDWQGSLKPAYEDFKKFKKGDLVRIVFVDKLGKDKKIYHNIAAIYPATNETVISRPMENEEVPFPDEPTVAKPTQDAFGRRLALHGMVNSRLQNHTIQQVKMEIDELLALEDYINEKL